MTAVKKLVWADLQAVRAKIDALAASKDVEPERSSDEEPERSSGENVELRLDL
jgi:hypothetical protein